VIALNSSPSTPGISLGGNAILKVNGDVTVNSTGGGVDENGQPVNNGNNGVAADGGTSTNSIYGVFANNISVVGGVNNPALFKNFDTTITLSPLKTKQLPDPDPLSTLPTPYTGNGVINAVKTIPNGNVTLDPGIYSQIKITGGTVTFNPGIYVVKGGGISITNNAIVTGKGVMFYNTGTDYDPATGSPDIGDSADPLGLTQPTGSQSIFSGIGLSAAVQLSPINTLDNTINYTSAQRAALAPFNGMLFYQRRGNTQGYTISGNASSAQLTGTIYTKWGLMTISGSGVYLAQLVVGNLKLNGNGNVSIVYNGSNLGKAPQVFLVE
jgi:hypothetical protein